MSSSVRTSFTSFVARGGGGSGGLSTGRSGTGAIAFADGGGGKRRGVGECTFLGASGRCAKIFTCSCTRGKLVSFRRTSGGGAGGGVEDGGRGPASVGGIGGGGNEGGRGSPSAGSAGGGEGGGMGGGVGFRGGGTRGGDTRLERGGLQRSSRRSWSYARSSRLFTLRLSGM